MQHLCKKKILDFFRSIGGEIIQIQPNVSEKWHLYGKKICIDLTKYRRQKKILEKIWREIYFWDVMFFVFVENIRQIKSLSRFIFSVWEFEFFSCKKKKITLVILKNKGEKNGKI